MRSDFKFGLMAGAIFSVAFLTVYLVAAGRAASQPQDIADDLQGSSAMQPLRTQQQGFLPEGRSEFVEQFRQRRESEPTLPQQGIRPDEQQTEPPQTQQPPASTPQKPQEKQLRKYTVVSGDTLSGISMRFYNTTLKWQKILEANRNTLENPAGLKPGMELIIPD